MTDVEVFKAKLLDYCRMRCRSAEEAVLREVLAGNSCKEMAERAALAELTAFQDAINDSDHPREVEDRAGRRSHD